MNFLFALLPLYRLHIVGKSMEPTFSDGMVVIVNRLAYLFTKPNVDDIVALHDPRDDKILVKRIIHNESDTFFVQGDNKSHSTDSREFGMIKQNNIIGKIII